MGAGLHGKKNINKDALSKWWRKINSWQKKKCLSYKKSTKVIKPQSVIETLHKITKGKLSFSNHFKNLSIFAFENFSRKFDYHLVVMCCH